MRVRFVHRPPILGRRQDSAVRLYILGGDVVPPDEPVGQLVVNNGCVSLSMSLVLEPGLFIT
jgi:hypothetical protein